jgi:hypothetical protein
LIAFTNHDHQKPIYRHETSLPLPRRPRPAHGRRSRHLRPLQGHAEIQHDLQDQAEPALPAPVRPGTVPDQGHWPPQGPEEHDPGRVCRG